MGSREELFASKVSIKTMEVSQLQFPVVIFDEEETELFQVITSEKSLLTTDPLTLKEEKHLRFIIVDMTGCRYNILAVKRIGKSKLADLADTLLNQPVKIELQLNHACREMPLAEFASRIQTAFQDATFAEVWEESDLNLSELDQFMGSAKTISEIILYLSR
jgi:hypothetical protein